MKKIKLLAVLSLLFVTSVTAVANENTSGGGRLEDLEDQSLTRKLENVGGGTWIYISKESGVESSYAHRSKKHSTTITTGSRYVKDTRAAGTTAKVTATYVKKKNAIYWDNAPSGKIGWSSGGSW